MILTPNVLSVLRGFLIFFFLIDSVICRCIAIFLAMLTDTLDGYLARRWNMTSWLGAVLDPFTDKLFVLFAVGIFINEGRLDVLQALSFFSRDFAIVVFGIYLTVKSTWSNFQFQSIIAGKMMTIVQFCVLLSLTLGWTIPPYIFVCFILLGIMAFAELYVIERRTAS